MTATTSSRNSDYLIAVASAVLGHFLVFLVFVGLAAARISAPPPTASEAVVPPEVMVEIRPELFQRPPEKTPPPPERNQYVRTLASQEAAEEARETNLIGEYNTKARSDRAPDPGAPLRPALDGEEPQRPDQLQTFDSSFQDGVTPTVKPQEAVPESAPPGQEQEAPSEEMVQDEIPPTEPLPPVSPPEEVLLTENRVAVPQLDGPGAERREESLPRETPAKPDPNSQQQPGGESVPAEERKAVAAEDDPGFQGEVRKRRLRGSIGRNGPSSAEVKNTPLGSYQALLSRAVEREWQINCVRYRDHITPGVLTIRFLVDDGGTVSGFRFLDVLEAGEIQKGFTMNAIKGAPIPAMSPVLKKELGGEPLELIYNFYF